MPTPNGLHYVETMLFDRPRTLRVRFIDVRDLSKRLGGLAIVPMLDRLREWDPEVILQGLHCALRHEDPSLSVEDVQAMVQTVMEQPGKSLRDVVEELTKAFLVSGLIRAVEADAPPDPTTATASTPTAT